MVIPKICPVLLMHAVVGTAGAWAEYSLETWLDRSRYKKARTKCMRYPRATLVFAIAVTILFTLPAIISVVGGLAILSLGFLPFALLGQDLALLAWVTSFLGGLRSKTLFGCRTLRWTEVTRVTWSPVAKRFVFETAKPGRAG